MAPTHPASSLDFLSRLHDGELSSPERAAFDAHVAGCDECREAVAAFERSLDAFRAAPGVPTPADLSARILRKIRAQSPSRRPFGVMFGIDIRWAGVFMAALLVVIIAPALFERRETGPAPTAREPLTAYVVDGEADKGEAAPENKTRAKAAPKAAPAAGAPVPKENEHARVPEAHDEFAQAPAPAPAPETVGGAVAPKPQLQAGIRSEESRQVAAQNAAPSTSAKQNAAPPPSVAPRSAAVTDKVGGESGAFAKEETPLEDIHLDVRSLDADGGAPEIVHTPPAERLLPLRGREFVLIVEADGFVRGVLPAARPDAQEKLDKDRASDAAASGAALRDVRFRATGRPRRVLLQIR